MKRRIRVLSLTIISVLILGIPVGCGSSKAKTTYDEVNKVTFDDNKNETVEPQNKENSYQEAEIEAVEDENALSEEDFIARFGRGINIGNSLDCFDEWNEEAVVTETYWGNPEITEAYVNRLVECGFKTIRIPVTWAPHIENDKVDESFMTRVKQVVDYAYNAGANVIIDIHHDRKFAPSYGNYNFAREYLVNVWTQVAEEFKDYDERLIFEGINEPRFYGRADEWSDGTPEGADNVNKLMNDFVGTVRRTGGNNATRLLLITCYCNRSGTGALSQMEIPEDDNLAISVHSYDPYSFTASSSPMEFDDNLKRTLDLDVNGLKKYKDSQKIPIIVTECGAYESVGKSGRIAYIEYLLQALDEAGIPCVFWDNGQGYGYGAYGIIERNSGYPYEPDILDAIMKEN